MKPPRASAHAPEDVLSSLLALFPLDVVLFPAMPFPLHIFEPRYREMISDCLARNEFFGVVRMKEEGVANVGCTAEITSVVKKYDDGRMDILTEGRRRFEILEVDQERAYLRAEVIYLEDEPGLVSGEEIERASRLHAEIMKLAGAEVESSTPVDREQFSFHLAGTLPLDLDFKQNLLTMKSESERIEAVIAYLETILPNLRRSVQARKTASGNGHVH
jgi:Lon protease-like protein